MAKHSSKSERREPRHIRLYSWEYNSVAFLALTPNEVRVYTHMRTLYDGKNNGQIVYSSRMAANICHKTNSTGARALTRLIELGFIRVSKDSSYGQKRLAREFELTAIGLEPAKKGNQLPIGTKEFLRWNSQSILAHDTKKLVQEALKKKPCKKIDSPIHGGHSATGGMHSPSDGASLN